MANHTIDEGLLAAYLNGELPPEKVAEVENWLDEAEENRQLLGEVYRVLFLCDRVAAVEEIDVERSLRRVKHRMMAAHRSRMRRIMGRIAAAAAIVAVAVWAGAGLDSIAKRLAKPLVVSTRMGERSQVVLPDGSKVWLNSCSRVTYSAPLFARERRVQMDGEAYFEVEHDDSSPFVVSTNGLNIEVLGTRFNIRNDDTRMTVTTVLLEGSIMAYTRREEPVFVHPAEQVDFDIRNGSLTLKRAPSTDGAIHWIDGCLHFDRNTFEEIVAELKRYYNVDVYFSSPALRYERFSGDFHVEDGIYHIMSVLKLTRKFDYSVSGNDIFLRSVGSE